MKTCTFCHDEATDVIEWKGHQVPGMPLNVNRTHVCSTCMEAMNFMQTIVEDGDYISTESMEN